MFSIRLICVALLLALSACAGVTQQTAAAGGSPLIDEPTPPFPYNSRFCM